MEFLPPKATMTMLSRHGITGVVDGELLRFRLGSGDDDADDIQHLVIGADHAVKSHDGATRTATCASDRLGRAAEEIIHKTHIAEWVVIPSGRWRSVLDLVAYTLAADEDWQSVDAEAALHMNTHDPLGFALGERHAVAALIGALVEAASGPEHGITIASIDAPILLELRHDGTMSVWCVGADLCETLAHLVR